MSRITSNISNGARDFSTRICLQNSVIPRRQLAFSFVVLLILGITVPAVGQDNKKPQGEGNNENVAAEGEQPQEQTEALLSLPTVIPGGIILAVLSVLFAVTGAWVKKDSRRQGLGSKKWTRIVTAPFALAGVALAVSIALNWTEYAFLETAGLWGALGGLAAIWLLPFVLYIVIRSRAMGDTGEVEAAPPEVTLIATCREVPEENTLLVEKLAESPEFADLLRIFAEAFAARTPIVLFDLAQGGLHVRYDVDGMKMATRTREHLLNGRKLGKKDPEVWVDTPPLDAVTGEKIIVALMRLAGLSPKKRGRTQVGHFDVTVDGKKRTCRLNTKVIKGHEQLSIDLSEPPKKFKTAEDLGMPSEMLDSLQQLVNLKRGLFIVSASKGNGESTLFNMTVTAGDRLMRDFISIEEKNESPSEIQNVKVQKYDTEAGESPNQAIEKAMLSYPSGFVTRNLSDPNFAGELVKRAMEDKMVIVSVQAQDSIDAVEKILELGISQDDLAKCLVGSVSQKLVRRLCARCAKEQETPLPLLGKYKKSIDDVPHIRTVSEYGGCRLCCGRGYTSRIGAFELASGITLRKGVAKGVDTATLKKAASKDGYRSMRDQGMEIVFSGATSLEEMQRVFSAKKKKPSTSQQKPKVRS